MSWVITKAPLRKCSVLQKCLLDSSHHIHIWRVSPQLSCGDTCQIWTCWKIKKITERKKLASLPPPPPPPPHTHTHTHPPNPSPQPPPHPPYSGESNTPFVKETPTYTCMGVSRIDYVFCIFMSHQTIPKISSHIIATIWDGKTTKASDAELWCFLWSAPE